MFFLRDLSDFMKEPTNQAQSIEEASSTSKYFEEHWKASLSVSFIELFGVKADAEHTRRETHIKNNTTKIEISYANIDTFPIVPGAWFDEQAIGRFASRMNEMRSTQFGARMGSSR